MRVLIVKLSSLGDVVHAMPAVQDIRRARPDAVIDWVVEQGFAPLVQRCEGVARVIPCELRRWRKSALSRQTRHEWRAFREALQHEAYDAVIDLQGLTKSALVAHTARLAPGGKRYALANQTEGSGYEAPTRWVADVAVRVETRIHAVDRSRQLCARALGYTPGPAEHFGLLARGAAGSAAGQEVALVHGTSRDDKLWPEAHWVALGRRLASAGFALGLPHGSEAERARSERLAAALGAAARVWPRLDLGLLADRLAGCAGVVGVDSGLSHVATALDRPHVQVYNFDTAWRTGPVGRPRQVAVYAAPTPAVDAVWQAWQTVHGAAGAGVGGAQAL
ncbi:lipopolysaccharide heptosyltransferase I [Ramlibacter tataouinensis]|nr:lipopolysaccharide heptosyltransferase I [Ramlibacter tataouinensis]